MIDDFERKNNDSVIELIKKSEETFIKNAELVSKINLEDKKKLREVKQLEDEKWSELKEIIEGEEFFKLEHINKLKLPYDIFICLSSKNSGKTWEQYRMFQEFIDKGEKFFFMRVLKIELDQASVQFANDNNCPIVMIKHDSRYLIYSKKAYENLCEEYAFYGKDKPNLTHKLMQKYEISEVGYAVDFRSASTIGGDSFEGFKYVVFDECLTHNPRNLVTKDHVNDFSKFLSSIIRNKKGEFKVYMFGNLTRKNNLILEHCGIFLTDNFRYKDNEDCKILYVNFRDMYSASYRYQSSVTRAFTDAYGFLELSNNLPRMLHDKILNTDPTSNFEFKLIKVIAYRQNKRKNLLNLYEFSNSGTVSYLIQIKELVPEDVFNYEIDIFTDNVHLSLLGKGKIIRDPKIWKETKFIFSLYKDDCLYYADASSFDDFAYVFDKYRKI